MEIHVLCMWRWRWGVGGNMCHPASWVAPGYTKLHLWNLTQFSKVVYIDADAIVTRNVDEVRCHVALDDDLAQRIWVCLLPISVAVVTAGVIVAWSLWRRCLFGCNGSAL